jgi:hypothetical protein
MLGTACCNSVPCCGKTLVLVLLQLLPLVVVV